MATFQGKDSSTVRAEAQKTSSPRTVAGNRLLVTDGDCGFCQASAAFLQKHFAGNWVNQPSQSFDYTTVGLTADDVAKQVWFVRDSDGAIEKWGGAQAVAKLLLEQRRVWIKPLAVLAFVPGFREIAQWLYRVVSRNRGKLPGASTACELP